MVLRQVEVIMRVFIGISVPQEIKEKLYEIQQSVLSNSIKSQKTRLDNFHITLLFIGNVPKNDIDDIINAMDLLFKDDLSFNITLGDIGHFIKKDQVIIWMGVDQGTSNLKCLSKKAYQEFKSYLKNTEPTFKPHLTLARSVVFNHSVDNILIPFYSLKFHVDTIILYESTRVLDQLCYLPIHEIKLKNRI